MGDYDTITHVLFWVVFVLNPVALAAVDVSLVRRGQRWAVWVASVVMVLACAALYEYLLNHNWLGTDPGYAGDYPPIWRYPAPLITPLLYFGLPALLVARRAMRAGNLRRTLMTGGVSLLGALPLGLLAELAARRGPWL